MFGLFAIFTLSLAQAVVLDCVEKRSDLKSDVSATNSSFACVSEPNLRVFLNIEVLVAIRIA